MSRTIKPQRLDPKDPGEDVFVVWEFEALTSTPTSPVVTVTRHAGEADATPSAIVSGSPTISGTKVLQKVVDGTDGTDYSMRCEVDGPDGSHWVLVGVLPVRAA